MLTYPQINPVLIAVGPFKVHWYGMMYLFGFLLAYWLAFGRSKRVDSPVKPEQVEDLILYGAFGVVLGGRIGYVFFYGFDQFLQDPLWLFKVWDGGMSFHGGLLGVLIAMGLYAKKLQCTFFQLTDFIAPMVPVGLGFGRIGNFINQELWGRETNISWAMVFPNDPLMLSRHPSQLYQFALEGVLLFIILFSFSHKLRPRYAVSALFLLCYGVFRFVVEFFREPDAQIGYEWFGWMTRGQELCLPMIAAGVLLLWYAYRGKSVHPVQASSTGIPVSSPVVSTNEVMTEITTESAMQSDAVSAARKPARAKPKTEKPAALKATTVKTAAAKPAPTKKSRPATSAGESEIKSETKSSKAKVSASKPKAKTSKENEVKKGK